MQPIGRPFALHSQDGGRVRSIAGRFTVAASAAIALLAALLLATPSSSQVRGPVGPSRYVNPFIGTAEHGHTYPGATVPFGMVQASPDAGKKGWDWCSGYHYSDTALIGFSHTHLSGTGCADLGDILFMPTTSWRSVDRTYRSPFVHSKERAEAGYYAVDLLDHAIQVELTATKRAAMHRYSFPRTDSAMVIIDLGYGQDDTPLETEMNIGHGDIVIGSRRSQGWASNQRVYFAARFSAPFQSFLVREGNTWRSAGGPFKDRALLAVLRFGPIGGEPLLVKVGISSVSEENALRNLDAEIPHWDFEKVRSEARLAWDEALSVCDVTTSDNALKETFYTALYHSFLAPTLYCDVDGRYRGGDDEIHEAKGFEHHTVFSLWDTFRALHPLLTVVQPKRVPDLVQSLLAYYRESRLLPVWTLCANETNCMIGYHSVPVIADALLKGFTGFDPNEAFEAMKASAFQRRGGLSYYNAGTPVPLDEKLKENELPDPAHFGRDSWPGRTAYLCGYASTIGGETIGYHSSHPKANDALLVRATTGEMSIEWETRPVPQSYSEDFASFTWIAGVCTNRGTHAFDLSIDGRKEMTIRSARSPADRALYFESKSGVTLRFHSVMTDVFDDLFGNMTLTVPRSMLKPGKPLRLKLVGEQGGSSDWLMVFQYGLEADISFSNAIGIAEKDGGRYQFIQAQIEHLARPSEFIFRPVGSPEQRVLALPGYNLYQFPVPVVTEAKRMEIRYSLEAGGEAAFEWMVQPVRTFGYIPADKENESVSKTLEYAFDDWCIAQTAKRLGREAEAAQFEERARFYKNVYDPGTGFMRGRNSDGSWRVPFNPRFSTLKQHEYTEGNAWQYSWFVPHDVEDLIGLMGGRDAFARKLDSLFSQSSDLEGTGATGDVTGLIGLYAHGNEPSHHIAYLYNYAGQPWKTQALARRIMSSFYNNTPGGLIGNEDCGQMSAWYILSAWGLYPVNPASGEYAIGSPIFDRASIQLEGGKSLVIEAENLSMENVYVSSATWNGKPLAAPFIRHEDIMRGGTLHFTMSATPGGSWGRP